MNTACPDCGSKEIKQDRSEKVCRACGLVVEDSEIEQPFISASIENHATMPYLAVAGTKATNGKIYKAIWLLSTREKNLQAANNKIDEIASRLKIPDFIITESKLIFKKSQYSNVTIGRGTNNTTLTYASVYLACKIHKLPKTALELTAYSEIDSNQLMTAYRKITRTLKLEIKPTDPIDLLPRFASKLELKAEVVNRVQELVERIRHTRISAGRKPESILAGAIYVASQEQNDPRTQRQIANSIGIIEITIRDISKKITNFLNE